MWEFLQAYGYWIVFGLFLVFMLRMHAGGCGMGHGQHGDHGADKPTGRDKDSESGAATRTPVGRASAHH